MLRKLAAYVAVGTLLAAMALPISCGTSTSSPEVTDTDGDGLSDRDELYLYGTSPLLADTDGDGWSDYAEVIDFGFDAENAPYRFNPLIADLPELAVVLTSPPLLTIEATDERGEIWTVTTTRTDENTLTVTTSASTTETESETIETPTTVTDSVEVTETVTVDEALDEREFLDAGHEHDAGHLDAGVDAGDAGRAEDAGKGEPGSVSRDVAVTRTHSVSSTFNPSSTVEASFTFTEEQSQAYTQAVSLAEAYERSHIVTLISGILLITATVENRGDVAFRVSNLLLAATMENSPPAFTPIGNLFVEAPYSNFQPFSLAPGERTAPLTFVRDGLTLEAAQAIFRDPRALNIELGLFEVDDATSRAYGFTVGSVYTKTATVFIDYGDLRPAERHQVATKADPSRTSVSLRRAFDIMRIPFAAPSETGLRSVRNIGPSTHPEGHWTVTLDHSDGAGVIITTDFDPTIQPYDFGDIELYAGDMLHLAFVRP